MGRRTLRLVVIPVLIVVTVGYIAAAVVVGTSSSDWHAPDTFSALAGGAFFVMSTLFAISLEDRAEKSDELLHEVRKVQDNQQEMLVRLGVKLEVDLESLADLPAKVVRPSQPGRAPTGGPVVAETTSNVKQGVPPPLNGIRIRLLAFLNRPLPRARGLDTAIDLRSDEKTVRKRFTESTILALGQPATGPNGEANFLEFTTDDPQGTERTFVPVFTRYAAITGALRRNPDWTQLELLPIEGEALLRAIAPDTTIVINPWMPEFAYALPARQGKPRRVVLRGLPRE